MSYGCIVSSIDGGQHESAAVAHTGAQCMCVGRTADRPILYVLRLFEKVGSTGAEPNADTT